MAHTIACRAKEEWETVERGVRGGSRQEGVGKKICAKTFLWVRLTCPFFPIRL